MEFCTVISEYIKNIVFLCRYFYGIQYALKSGNVTFLIYFLDSTKNYSLTVLSSPALVYLLEIIYSFTHLGGWVDLCVLWGEGGSMKRVGLTQSAAEQSLLGT